MSDSLKLESILVSGIRIHVLKTDLLYDSVMDLVRGGGRQHLVTYVNCHTMNSATDDPVLKKAYSKSAITYCDGAGVVIGAKILGRHLPERMTSATFIHDFCKKWQDEGIRIFFLGGLPKVAQKACEHLKQLYPKLEIAGFHHGYFQKNGTEEEAVISMISKARPHILFIGFGTPLQEYWAIRNEERLNANVIWPIGALVDYLSGQVSRCPEWMANHSLEWLFRFMIEPRRMFKRYIIGNPLFIYRILRERLKNP
ncbi:WecB/TagA/CpsF family glycosyltransferase [Desulfobacterales bacterium HSG16]|nr:WecB/TagA/CpsF family glycosyltransferase [Desulfobacterales bacterium HSG16]